MADKVYNVLFLCTGNSARSIMAECALNRWGQGRFHAFSAGSHPNGPGAPDGAAAAAGPRTTIPSGLRSKSWEEFTAPGAPVLDFVFTVCDSAAAEVCPVWPGQPMTAHWGVEDPAAFVGSDEKTYQFFRNVYGYLDNRIKIFVSLPVASLDRMSLQKRLEAIGTEAPPGAEPGRLMTDVTIYHNPACGTSRNVLGLIRNSGVEPTIIEYLEDPARRAASLST